MITLHNTGVAFDEARHSYELEGKQLQGITGLLHRKLFSDMYADIPESVLNAAAERGKQIHSAIQLYDETGYDVHEAVQWYAAMSENHPFLKNHIRSEYLVTDGYTYASAIDKVYELDEGVILADIKTTSNLNIDYVSWQLSIYAYLFRLANPDIPVLGLFAIWLKDEKHNGIREVALHSEEEVRVLLYTDDAPATKPPTYESNVEKLYTLKLTLEEAKRAYEEELNRVYELMVKEHAQSYRTDNLLITRTEDSEQLRFDSTSFKKANPELYKQFVKSTKTKGGLRIKLLQ